MVHLVHPLFDRIRNINTKFHIIGISDAYYCAECTRLEKDRDGCPKIVNLGASRTDLFYERRRLGEWTMYCHLYSTSLSFLIPQVSRRASVDVCIMYI